MPEAEIMVRLLRKADFDQVVRIDRIHFGQERADFFARCFTAALDGSEQVMISLVAELDGRVAGFIMGELHLGEFGVPENTASVDSIGVDPACQHQGVARELMKDFIRNARIAGVERLYTRVVRDDHDLVLFFDSVGFVPAQMISLELDISAP